MNWRFITKLNRITSYGIGAVLFLLSAFHFYIWFVLEMGYVNAIAALLFLVAGILSFAPENKRTLSIIRDILIAFASLIVNNVLLGLIICVTSIIRVLISDPPS